DAAVQTAVALLVVTCPCGLALATPLAVSAALGQAARAGWLIKGGAALEALARPALIVFDKTGTLTRGELAVLRWYGDPSLGPEIKALEKASSHPIARALLQALDGVEAAAASDVVEQLGFGVEGLAAGRRVSVGAAQGAPEPVPPCAAAALEALGEEGLTPIVVCVDGELRSVIGL